MAQAVPNTGCQGLCCPWCVLQVSHNSTVDQARDSTFRSVEHAQACGGSEWIVNMKVAAYGEIVTRSLGSEQALQRVGELLPRHRASPWALWLWPNVTRQNIPFGQRAGRAASGVVPAPPGLPPPPAPPPPPRQPSPSRSGSTGAAVLTSASALSHAPAAVPIFSGDGVATGVMKARWQVVTGQKNH